MWNLIPQMRMPPTRIARYCCSILKEQGGKDRMITTGVRWSESFKRKQTRGIYENFSGDIRKKIILTNDNDDTRKLFEDCRIKAKRVCNPIIDWTDRDVWDYIESEHIETNPLYGCGFHRVGCIGCPMAGSKSMQFEFARYPKYRDMYIRAFDHMIEERIRRGKMGGSWRMGTTGMDVFHWWVNDGVLPGQMELWEDDNETDPV